MDYHPPQCFSTGRIMGFAAPCLGMNVARCPAYGRPGLSPTSGPTASAPAGPDASPLAQPPAPGNG